MKNSLLTKFTVWLLLVCLLCGCTGSPADPTIDSSEPVHSTETDPSVEATIPTESEATEPTQPTTEPTQPTTPPAEPPTQPPTEAPTQPSTQAPTEPSTEPSTAPSTQPPTQPTEPEPTLPPAVEYVPPQADDPAGDKIIYLTFDDGPGYHTPQLLAVLEKYNVKATFFVVGSAYLEYLDDIADAGHAIGIHTDTHRYETIYSSTDAFWKDLNAMEEKIFQHTGIHTKLHRFPGGSSNSVSKKYCPGIMTKLVQEVTDQGYYYFDWNVDSNDAGGAKTAAEVYHNVITAVQGKDFSVVLMHDVKRYTVESIESIIRWGLQNGYVFLPLDESAPGAHHTVRN